MRVQMELAAKIDNYGKGAWIGLMVLSFILFWPIGLALLAFLLYSGRLGKGGRAPGRWHNQRGGGCGWRRQKATGNMAFDEYREETLRRLEDEQAEFETFLDRLRKAKDQQEFDDFMQDRGRRMREEDDSSERADPADKDAAAKRKEPKPPAN
jgi:hypothetical protein